ncbi:MAG: hypothetical protein IJF71_06265 [Clostridia bacterium]|nr:hypothetical protein [Clostridia bacterium]
MNSLDTVYESSFGSASAMTSSICNFGNGNMGVGLRNIIQSADSERNIKLLADIQRMVASTQKSTINTIIASSLATVAICLTSGYYFYKYISCSKSKKDVSQKNSDKNFFLNKVYPL